MSLKLRANKKILAYLYITSRNAEAYDCLFGYAWPFMKTLIVEFNNTKIFEKDLF